MIRFEPLLIINCPKARCVYLHGLSGHSHTGCLVDLMGKCAECKERLWALE